MFERQSYQTEPHGKRYYYGDPIELDCIACNGSGEEEGDQAEYDANQKYLESIKSTSNYDEDF